LSRRETRRGPRGVRRVPRAVIFAMRLSGHLYPHMDQPDGFATWALAGRCRRREPMIHSPPGDGTEENSDAADVDSRQRRPQAQKWLSHGIKAAAVRRGAFYRGGDFAVTA
jgi:hypothetical protein